MDQDPQPIPSATRHVRALYGNGPDGLDRAADAVTATLASDGWTVLMALAERETLSISAELNRASKPLEQAEYALKHGRMGGIQVVREAAEALIARRDQVMAEQRAKHETPGESGSEE